MTPNTPSTQSGEVGQPEFPIRNFMVRYDHHKKHEPNKYYPDGDYCFASGWLHQKHPYGYDVDYFTTRADAISAIERCKEENPQEQGYWLTFVIYELTDVTAIRRPQTPAANWVRFVHSQEHVKEILDYCEVVEKEAARVATLAENKRVLDELYSLAEDMILDGERMIREEPNGKLYGKGKFTTANVFQMRIESLMQEEQECEPE